MTKKIFFLLFILIFAYMYFFPYFISDMANRPTLEKLGYTPRGKFLKIILGEFRWFGGQYLTFKSIIYYGGKRDIKNNKFGQIEFYNLYKTLETAVILNPYHEDTYYFIQAVFTWGIERIKEVNRILKYVMKYRKWDYKVPFFLGFNYAYFLKDFKTAAQYYKIASTLSKIPWITNLAARYFYEGGETKLGIIYLNAMLKITKNEKIKKIYKIRLKTLKLIYKIESAILKYKKKYNKSPSSIEELYKLRFLNEIPIDPYGGKFYIDKDGKVKSTSKLAFSKKERLWK